MQKKYSIELEKCVNVALNIINDSIFIKPNAPVGNDNEPTYTASSGVADIEDQWFNEGQQSGILKKMSEAKFIAPKLHQDTVNTFYNSVKYEYGGENQKIIPITITQFFAILQAIKLIIKKNRKFTHTELMIFYETRVDMSKVANSQG